MVLYLLKRENATSFLFTNTANKLYWCDARLDRLEVFNLNTMERVVLLDLGPEAHPFSIALHGSYIYWSDWTQKSLMRADKNTGANNGSVGAAAFAGLNGLYSYSTRDHAPCEYGSY